MADAAPFSDINRLAREGERDSLLDTTALAALRERAEFAPIRTAIAK